MRWDPCSFDKTLNWQVSFLICFNAAPSSALTRRTACASEMRVAGLDLARRSDHSALVLLDVEPDRLIVTAALRLQQAPLREQFTLIAPRLAGLDLLVFDQSGLGDAAAELLPKTPPHVGVCLIGGDRPLARSTHGDRLVIGKAWLIQRLGVAIRSGDLTVAEHAPGRELLRGE